MKKIIITGLIVISNFVLAQDNSNNPYIYQTNQEEVADEYPSNPGDPGSVPIDDYIPALLIIASALLVYTANKKKLHVNN